MSQYVSPFLVINIGAEMVYVVSQRLEAQKVSMERSEIVLDEILSSLLAKPLICDLMKPQQPLCHSEIRSIVEDVAQCSAMRLDPVSMNKLWDLITMVFKWQMTLCEDVFKVTTRHLREMKTYTSRQATKLQVQRVQTIVDNFSKLLDTKEQSMLREGLLEWLKPFNVRVSLLLRLGLQDSNAKFVVNNTDLIAREMLNNLGENIYAVTQNGKAVERVIKQQPYDENENATTSTVETNELNFFMDQIGGKRPRCLGVAEKSNPLTLSIGNKEERGVKVKRVEFEEVSVDRVNANEVVEKMMEIDVDENESAELKEDLLDLIQTE